MWESRTGRFDFYSKSIGGSDTAAPIAPETAPDAGGANNQWFPHSWSSDGLWIAGAMNDAAGGTDVFLVSLDGSGERRAYVDSQFDENEPAISPDGRWIAWSSTESGRKEIYVGSFPEAGRRWQVSTGGGSEARWRGDSQELFFRSPTDEIMSVEMNSSGEALRIGRTESLFQAPLAAFPNWDYAVTADGQRFLLNTRIDDDAATPLRLIVNWPQLLE